MPTPASSELDKFGRDYNELLSLQRQQLFLLKNVLTSDAHDTLSAWCETVNAPAQERERSREYIAGGLHTVPVGQELFHFLMDLAKPKEHVTKPAAKQRTISHGIRHQTHR